MPATVKATGIMSQAVSKLETLLAKSTIFRAECGVPLEAQAKERIYYPHLENSGLDDSWLRNMPYAIITNGPIQATKDSAGTFDRGGRLTVLFRSETKFDIKDMSTLKDALLAFLNYTDGVLLEMEADSITDDNLAIQSYVEIVPAQLNSPMQQADPAQGRPYWDRAFEIAFNPVGGAEGGG